MSTTTEQTSVAVTVQRYCFGRFELQPVTRRVLRDGQPLALGARGFDLLLALVERRHRLVSKTELLELVWPGLAVEEANLPVQISGLRKLIGAQSIATISGRGYRFAMPVDVDRDTATSLAYRAVSRTAASGRLGLLRAFSDERLDGIERLLLQRLAAFDDLDVDAVLTALAGLVSKVLVARA